MILNYIERNPLLNQIVERETLCHLATIHTCLDVLCTSHAQSSARSALPVHCRSGLSSLKEVIKDPVIFRAFFANVGVKLGKQRG